MRVLVTGGRNNIEWTALWRTLDELKPSVVIEGGCTGFDAGAAEWCDKHPEVEHKQCNAPWLYLGHYAGPLRNIYMLEHYKPDLVVAGPRDGDSGTENTVRNAMLRGIPVRRINA